MNHQVVRRCAVAFLAVLLLGGCREAAAPAPAPAASTASTATDLVDAPTSRLNTVVSASGVRAALWTRCSTKRCANLEAALVLVGDGATRIVVDRTWHSVPLIRMSDTGDVLVVDGGARPRLSIVHPDGTLADVATTGDVGPVLAGEVVGGVAYRAKGASFFATDPATAVAHAVAVPPGTQQLTQLTGGQLRAVTRRRTYGWSDGGGATWHESAIPGAARLNESIVTSTPDRHVLVGGGDGATLFPFNAIQSRDGETWSVARPPTDPTAYIGPAAVLPDGRFLVAVQGWSDDSAPGLYVSSGDDWTSYERVDTGAPFEAPNPMQPMVTSIDVTASGATITAVGPDATSAWTSNDVGATWRRIPVR